MFERTYQQTIGPADMAESPNGRVLACCYPGCGVIHAWGAKAVDPSTYLLINPPTISGLKLVLTARSQPCSPTLCVSHAVERFPSTGARLALARAAEGTYWAYDLSATAGIGDFVLAWIASAAYVDVGFNPEASPASFEGLVLHKLLKGVTHAPADPGA